MHHDPLDSWHRISTTSPAHAPHQPRRPRRRLRRLHHPSHNNSSHRLARPSSTSSTQRYARVLIPTLMTRHQITHQRRPRRFTSPTSHPQRHVLAIPISQLITMNQHAPSSTRRTTPLPPSSTPPQADLLQLMNRHTGDHQVTRSSPSSSTAAALITRTMTAHTSATYAPVRKSSQEATANPSTATPLETFHASCPPTTVR